MSPGRSRYSDREIINRWAYTGITAHLSALLAARGMDSAEADGCIGFFYVDHEEGVSLRVTALCRSGTGQLPCIVADVPMEDVILRSGEVGPFTLLSEQQANELCLLEEQRWRVYHEPERLHEVRTRTDLDQFRAPGYFDDVSVVLLSPEQDHAEVVWVRLEEVVGGGNRFRGFLLNEPGADFGVHAGDYLVVSLRDEGDGRLLVSGPEQ
ncbi:MAG TPA: hypothetical protein PLN56_11055 [Methanoregulaceae archaeon]|nr:MAG: hypothetical protein IPI71_09550 [Methanolinea sp.]HON82472.1 hypothetical protein [Methanoregulaceae archaeon]HPD11518.1 hypothetical protein [Methanoregulaceae archaeon]